MHGGHVDRGFYIYSNGIIEEYDNYDKSRKLKSAKITSKELHELKSLADEVEDKYKKENSGWNDAGIASKQIYNNKKSKWIKISERGDSVGNNTTEKGKEILNLTNQLCDKYLTNDDGSNCFQKDERLLEWLN